MLEGTSGSPIMNFILKAEPAGVAQDFFQSHLAQLWVRTMFSFPQLPNPPPAILTSRQSLLVSSPNFSLSMVALPRTAEKAQVHLLSPTPCRNQGLPLPLKLSHSLEELDLLLQPLLTAQGLQPWSPACLFRTFLSLGSQNWTPVPLQRLPGQGFSFGPVDSGMAAAASFLQSVSE